MIHLMERMFPNNDPYCALFGCACFTMTGLLAGYLFLGLVSYILLTVIML